MLTEATGGQSEPLGEPRLSAWNCTTSYLPMLGEPLRLEPNTPAHRTAGISPNEGTGGGGDLLRANRGAARFRAVPATRPDTR